MWYNGGMDEEVSNILVATEELKRPLTTLRQMALSFDEMDDKNEHLRGEMIRVSDRAIRQVNDLMKIGKLENRLFEMEPVAVRGVCDEVTRELTNLFQFNRRDLFIRYSNRARLAWANYELLKSVVYNFLLNARNEAGVGRKADFDCDAPRVVWVGTLYCVAVFAIYGGERWCGAASRWDEFLCGTAGVSASEVV